MNRTDRLFAIVVELQSKRWRRAKDLAGAFETSNDAIYRDMLTLVEEASALLRAHQSN